MFWLMKLNYSNISGEIRYLVVSDSILDISSGQVCHNISWLKIQWDITPKPKYLMVPDFMRYYTKTTISHGCRFHEILHRTLISRGCINHETLHQNHNISRLQISWHITQNSNISWLQISWDLIAELQFVFLSFCHFVFLSLCLFVSFFCCCKVVKMLSC